MRLGPFVALVAFGCNPGAPAPAGDTATGSSSGASTSSSTSSSTTTDPSTRGSSDSSSESSDASSSSGDGVRDPANGHWEPRAPMLTPRSESDAAVIDDLIYVPGGFGGRDTLEVYDPAADEWTALADLPDGRDHAAVTALGGVLYVIGGGEGITGVLAYDPATDLWEQRARLPHARTAGAAVAYDNAVWLVGGNGPVTDTELQIILRYDPGADEWTEHGSLPEVREHLSVVLYEGVFRLLAGRNAGMFYTTTVDYDPTDESFTDQAMMLDRRAGFQAAIVDTWIFASGGELFEPAPVIVDAMEYYEPDDDAWHEAPALPAGVHGHGVASVGGVLYVVGGSDFAGGVMNMGRVWAYVL